MLSRPDRALRWDVLEVHLDEAAFLWSRREAALASPRYSLAEVADGPERRFLAHADALAVAGARAAARLLRPALESDEAEVRGAGAFALTCPGEGKDVRAVVDAITATDAEGRAPLLRALGLCHAPEASVDLAALLSSEDPGLVAQTLDALAFRRAVPEAEMVPLFGHPDPVVLAAAVRALRLAPGAARWEDVRHALQADEPELRLAAIVTGAVCGQREVFGAAREEIASPGPVGSMARLLAATLGDEKDTAALVELLGNEVLRREILVALGFGGRLAGADACLAWIEDRANGPVAADSFATISGIAIRGPLVLAPTGEEDEHDGEEPRSSEEDLADPVALRKQWEEHRPKLPRVGRLLRGKPYELGRFLEELVGGPTWRRESLAAELAIRSRGVVQVEALALTAVQALQLAPVRALRGGELSFERPPFA